MHAHVASVAFCALVLAVGRCCQPPLPVRSCFLPPVGDWCVHVLTTSAERLPGAGPAFCLGAAAQREIRETHTQPSGLAATGAHEGGALGALRLPGSLDLSEQGDVSPKADSGERSDIRAEWAGPGVSSRGPACTDGKESRLPGLPTLAFHAHVWMRDLGGEGGGGLS